VVSVCEFWCTFYFVIEVQLSLPVQTICLERCFSVIICYVSSAMQNPRYSYSVTHNDVGKLSGFYLQRIFNSC